MNGKNFVTCSCQIFGVIVNTLPDDVCDKQLDGNTCLHARLLKDILNPEDAPSPVIDYLNMEAIAKAKEFVKHPVVELPSKVNVYRFSVVVDSDAELVTYFYLTRTKKKIVTCHNSFCKSKGSHKRDLECYSTSTKLCSHLSTLRENFDLTTLKFDTEAEYDSDEDVIDDERESRDTGDSEESQEAPLPKKEVSNNFKIFLFV